MVHRSSCLWKGLNQDDGLQASLDPSMPQVRVSEFSSSATGDVSVSIRSIKIGKIWQNESEWSLQCSYTAQKKRPTTCSQAPETIRNLANAKGRLLEFLAKAWKKESKRAGKHVAMT